MEKYDKVFYWASPLLVIILYAVLLFLYQLVIGELDNLSDVFGPLFGLSLGPIINAYLYLSLICEFYKQYCILTLVSIGIVYLCTFFVFFLSNAAGFGDGFWIGVLIVLLKTIYFIPVYCAGYMRYEYEEELDSKQ